MRLHVAGALTCTRSERYETWRGDGTAPKPPDARPPVNLTEAFDVFVGTSTGAIIAAMLAQGLTARQLLNLYMGEDRKKIFSGSSFLAGLTGGLFTAKYDPDGLRKVFHENKRVFSKVCQ